MIANPYLQIIVYVTANHFIIVVHFQKTTWNIIYSALPQLMISEEANFLKKCYFVRIWSCETKKTSYLDFFILPFIFLFLFPSDPLVVFPFPILLFQHEGKLILYFHFAPLCFSPIIGGGASHIKILFPCIFFPFSFSLALKTIKSIFYIKSPPISFAPQNPKNWLMYTKLGSQFILIWLCGAITPMTEQVHPHSYLPQLHHQWEMLQWFCCIFTKIIPTTHHPLQD